MKRVTLTAIGVVLTLVAGQAQGVNLDINLVEGLDDYGNQIETVQIIDTGSGPATTFGIYDTGASVVFVSQLDQLFFDNPIPIKCAGCASADAIGGTLEGDVGTPLTIKADGLSAITFDFSGSNPDFFTVNDTNAAVVDDVQTFVGNDPDFDPFDPNQIPSITGTPIHKSGKAAYVNMLGYALDLGDLFPTLPELSGIELFFPDLSFVPPGSTTLAPAAGTVSDPVRIPLELIGPDNYAGPGNDVTSVQNPVHTMTGLEHNSLSVSDKTFLADTGSQLTILSTEIFDALDLASETIYTTIMVQGAAGTETVDGYIIDSLSLALDDDGDGIQDGTLTFHDVPIFVLDLPAGLDGILGMNLFNTATEMLYDPIDLNLNGASLTVAFDTDPLRESQLEALEGLGEDADLVLALLSLLVPAVGGVITPSFPSFQTEASTDGGSGGGPAAVPEPSTLLLGMLLGTAGFFARRRRRR